MGDESNLRKLKLNMLLKELDIIELNEKYAQEFNDHYRPLFIKEASKHRLDSEPINKNNSSEVKSKTEPFLVTEEEEIKIKEIFRSIAKQCHPDNTQDPKVI